MGLFVERLHSARLGLRIVTIIICVLGIVGNSVSIALLKKNRKSIPASVLLMGLAVADLLLVTCNFLILTILHHYRTQEYTFADWLFVYLYYCSIYMTVAIAINRYLAITRPFLMLKMDQSRLQCHAVCAVYVIMVLICLPFLVAIYHQSPALGSVYINDQVMAKLEDLRQLLCSGNNSFLLANLTVTSPHHLNASYQHEIIVHHTGGVSYEDDRALLHLLEVVCNSSMETGDRGYHSSIAGHQQGYSYDLEDLNNRYVIKAFPGYKALWADTSYTRGYYIGVDFPLRYVIPLLLLAFTNIRLLQAVYRSRKSSGELQRQGGGQRQSMNAVKSVTAILTVFIVCQTLGMGMFVRYVLDNDQVDVIYQSMAGIIAINMESRLTTFVIAVNSSVNCLIYCAFLPQFRRGTAQGRGRSGSGSHSQAVTQMSVGTEGDNRNDCTRF